MRLGWPVFIGQVAVVANGVIDTIMAGRYSTVDLAGVGVGAAIYFSIFIAMMGVLLALTQCSYGCLIGNSLLSLHQKAAAWIRVSITHV